MAPLLKYLFSVILILCVSESICSQSLTWQKYFNLINSDDEGWAICASDANNILVGGLTSESPMAFIMKMNQFGDTLWKKFYSDSYRVTSMVGMNDGGCIFSANYKLRRIDANGNTVWSVDAPSYESMLVTTNGFLIAPSYGIYNKYDLSGNLIWTKSITGLPAFNCVTECFEGGYLFAGCIQNKAFLLKTDTSGNETYVKQFNLSNYSYFSDILKVNNNYILFGGFNGNTDSTTKILIKFNSGLDSISSNVIYTKNIYYSSALLNSGNFFYLFYNCYSNNKQSFVIALYDTNFTMIRRTIYEPMVYYVNFSDAIFFPGSGNSRFAVAGITAVNGETNEDIYVASIDTSLNPIGIEPVSSFIPQKFELFQNYPNPFNPTTRIRFSVPYSSSGTQEITRIVIYDITGRIVSMPVDKILSPGEYEIEWNAGSLASGIYFCKLNNGTDEISMKMILLK